MSNSKTSLASILVPTLIALVAVGLLTFVVVSTTGDSGAANKHQEAKQPEDQQKVDVGELRDKDDPMALGKADAPVVMVWYSDFQCPYCGKFARDTEPDLLKEYVKDGTVRIEWRDFPYIGDDSWKGARAGRAAAEQDKFWEFHEALYADQPEANSGEMSDEFLKGIAKDAGMDVQKFNDDMHSDKFNDDIEDDFENGQSLGVNAAPTFFIGGKPIVGAQPKSAFTDVIDDEADEAD